MTIKRAVNEGLQMDLDSALAHEAGCFGLLFSTEDGREGQKGFTEKRKPVFKHR